MRLITQPKQTDLPNVRVSILDNFRSILTCGIASLKAWNASFRLCIRMRSLSLLSRRLRFLSLAFSIDFRRRPPVAPVALLVALFVSDNEAAALLAWLIVACASSEVGLAATCCCWPLAELILATSGCRVLSVSAAAAAAAATLNSADWVSNRSATMLVIVCVSKRDCDAHADDDDDDGDDTNEEPVDKRPIKGFRVPLDFAAASSTLTCSFAVASSTLAAQRLTSGLLLSSSQSVTSFRTRLETARV